MKTPIIEGVSEPGLVSYLKSRQYDALYWPNFFPLQNVNTLDGKTLIGAVGSRVAAYIIAYDAKAPEVGRKGIQTTHFDIPKIAIARPKNEKQILEHAVTRAIRGMDAVIEDMYNDVDFVVDAVNAKMESIVLTVMSTTKYQLTTTNNPLGIVNETVIDFGMPAANKKVATTAIWSTANAATMTPIADFKALIKAARDLGIYFERMLMHPDMFDLITGCTEFQTACKSLLVGESQILGMMSLDVVNKVLNTLRLPPISLIETSIATENKAGVLTEANPWDKNHILFVPQMRLGDFYNGPIAEELERPPMIIQSKKGNVLVSVERKFNPVSILTKGEANCFPSWPTIDRCFSLYTQSTSTWA